VVASLPPDTFASHYPRLLQYQFNLDFYCYRAHEINNNSSYNRPLEPGLTMTLTINFSSQVVVKVYNSTWRKIRRGSLAGRLAAIKAQCRGGEIPTLFLLVRPLLPASILTLNPTS